MVLNLEYEKLTRELKRIRPKRVLIQLAEGVKQNAFDILKVFEDLNIEAIFSGETCWGGCSIAVEEAKLVNADLIVHFGHSEFAKVNFPVLYIPIKDEINLTPLLKKSLKELKKFSKMGLSCSIQHIQDLDSVIKFYRDNKKEVILSKKRGRVAHEGQIVGCQYSGLKEIEKEVECFVIIGNNFHSMGAVLSVNKPVFLIDVYNDEIKLMKGIKDKIVKQRILSVEKFKNAKRIGIILELKQGQRFGSPKALVEKFKRAGKEVILITMNELTPDKLMNFYNVDGFVELACPRIAIDDFAKYNKPIITFREALVALGEKSWDDVLKQGLM
ncbi:MAG: diphthamide biosynthesis enzyme Dph2 [Candidatus Pacearchaeota archaeon]|nr:diphthamide biosynthesis enzyme Dph2 [Candidatus Pacearchaeota archaeon]